MAYKYRIRVETSKKGEDTYYPEKKFIPKYKWLNWLHVWGSVSGRTILYDGSSECEGAQTQIDRHKQQKIDEVLNVVVKIDYIDECKK